MSTSAPRVAQPIHLAFARSTLSATPQLEPLSECIDDVMAQHPKIRGALKRAGGLNERTLHCVGGAISRGGSAPEPCALVTMAGPLPYFASGGHVMHFARLGCEAPPGPAGGGVVTRTSASWSPSDMRALREGDSGVTRTPDSRMTPWRLLEPASMELVGAAERVAIFHRASHWDYPETGIYWVDINYIPGMKELFQGAAGADLRSVFITHTPQTFIAAADTVQAPAPWVWLPEPILREVGASHPLYLGVTDQLVTVASLLTGAQHTTHPLKNLKTFVGELCALPDPLWEHLWSDAMLQWLQKMLTHAERAAKKASKEGGSKLIQVSIDSCRIRVSPVGGAEKVLVLGPAPEDEGSAHVADSGTYLLDLLRRYDPKPFETHMSLRSLNGRKVLLLSDRSGWGRVGVTYF